MNSRIWRWAVCGLVLLPIGGCGIAADVLNTGFLTGLGLDTATIIPPQGSIIVAFNNTTKFPALFSAWESVDPVNLKRSSKNFSVEADGGQVKNQVLDCPIGAIAPGSLGANFTPEAQAAVVTVTDAQGAVTTTTVDYNGQPLESGIAYACGDVIEITLSQVTQASTTGQAQQSFAITVQVIPGR
jgi:hypothetical protein